MLIIGMFIGAFIGILVMCVLINGSNMDQYYYYNDKKDEEKNEEYRK